MWREESCQLLRPAGSSAPNTALDVVGHLCKGTLLAYSPLFAHQDIQVLLCQHSCPSECWCLWLFLPCCVSWGSSLDDSTPQWCISLCSCSVPLANWLAEHSVPESMSLMKKLNSISTTTVPWSPALGIGLQLEITGLALQPVCNPPHCPLNYFISHLSGVYFISLSMKLWCEKVSKIFLFISFLSGHAKEPLRHIHEVFNLFFLLNNFSKENYSGKFSEYLPYFKETYDILKFDI